MSQTLFLNPIPHLLAFAKNLILKRFHSFPSLVLLIAFLIFYAPENCAAQSSIAPSHAKLPYGAKERQWLNLYRASGETLRPVYVWAHGNGLNPEKVSPVLVKNLQEAKIGFISWNSIEKVTTPEEFKEAMEDQEAVFQWILANGETYNIDKNQIVMGGSSRGSGLSFNCAQSHPEIIGIYAAQAYGKAIFSMMDLKSKITAQSPPIYMTYELEPGTPDRHDPANGLKVAEYYKEVGLGDLATVKHSLKKTNTDLYTWIVPFIEDCVKRKQNGI